MHFKGIFLNVGLVRVDPREHRQYRIRVKNVYADDRLVANIYWLRKPPHMLDNTGRIRRGDRICWDGESLPSIPENLRRVDTMENTPATPSEHKTFSVMDAFTG